MEELRRLYELRVSGRIETFLGVKLNWTNHSDGRMASVNMDRSFYGERALRGFGLESSKHA